MSRKRPRLNQSPGEKGRVPPEDKRVTQGPRLVRQSAEEGPEQLGSHQRPQRDQHGHLIGHEQLRQGRGPLPARHGRP